jgi:hypothetical protein
MLHVQHHAVNSLTQKQLLILSQGRYLTSNDYDRFLTVFPGTSDSSVSCCILTHLQGTNLTGLKIKVSRFRVEQRTLYEQLGWQLPEGAASQKRKRGTSAEKPTAKRAKKEMAKGSESEDEIGGVDIGVKKEEVED